ncbi:hypothetical protein V5O48_012862 [Marasmius crinis-equi]|uniref:Uncharacterized protein n=1 Tax=Marasmius crinis-equi TaxID=585013 RepID=A0ABR3F1V0_9AGAR
MDPVLKYEDPTLLYGQLSHPTEVAKTGLVMASLVLGDSMLIYRLWVALLDGHDIFVSEAGRWITTDTVLTLCTNLYCSSLIALRIWNQSRETSPFLVNGGASNLLTKSFIVFVESAALYTIWTIISLATYESKSPVQFFMINCYAAIAGIAFMSINARMFLSSETIGSQKAFSSTSSSNSHRGDPGPGHTESTDTQDSYQLHAIPPVAVKINHIVEQRADPGSSGKEELYPSEFKH